jgi:hypothetical protein
MSSKQVLAEIEEEAIHVWREWPRYLVLKMRQKQAIVDLQDREEGIAGVTSSPFEEDGSVETHSGEEEHVDW